MSNVSAVKVRLDTWADEAAPNVNNGEAARLRITNLGSNRRWIYLFGPRPFPVGATVVSATLRLFAGNDWSGGPHTLTADRINQAWKESGPGHLDWTDRPTVAGASATRVISTNPANKEAVDIDVTTIMQAAASGSTYHGIRLQIDTTGQRSFYSAENKDSDLTPQLIVTWVLGPAPPSDLSPAGDLYVGTSKPAMTWEFEDQASFQFQLDDTADLSSPLFDSGVILSSEWQIDLGRQLIPLRNQTDVEAALGANEIVAIQTAVVARTTTAGEFNEGIAGVKATGHATNTFSGLNVGGSTGSTNLPAVSPTKQYVASVDLKGISGTPTVMIRLRWTDAAGAALSNSDSASFAVTAAFARYNFSAIAPASAAFVRMQVLFPAAGAGQIFVADRFMLEEGVNPGAWYPSFQPFAISDGQQRYWRVRATNNDGATSEWSDIASFWKISKGTLSITSPTAPFDDTSPVVVHSLGGGRTQAAVQYIVIDPTKTVSTNDLYNVVYNSGKIATTATSFTLPEKLFTKTGVTYKIVVRVWDTYNRVATSGVTTYLEAILSSAYVKNGTPTVVNSLSQIASNDPGVILQWSRAVRPDYFAVTVDGVYVEQRLDPAVLETSPGGSTYRFKLWTIRPDAANHTVGVEAVTLSSGKYINSTGVTLSVASSTKNKWLVCEGLDLATVIIGPTDPDFVIGEDGETFFVKGRRAPVRITDSMRGYEGTVVGAFADYKSVTAEAWRNIFELIKADENQHPLRLIWRDQNIEIIMGDVDGPSPQKAGWIDVGFAFWQTEDYTFKTKVKH